MKVDIAMRALFSSRIDINNLQVERLTSHINRRLPDSAFNFDYIVKAFAGPDTVVVDEDTVKEGGWKFGLYGLNLKDIYFTYKDDVTGTDAVTRLGHFKTSLDEFDLDEMVFAINDVALENTYASVIQNKAAPPSEDTSSVMPDIKFENIAFNNVRFYYNDKPGYKLMDFKLGKAEINADEIKLRNERIALNEVLVENSSGKFIINEYITPDTVLKEATKAVTTGPKEAETPSKWVITLNQLLLKNNAFVFDNHNQAPLHKGIDYSHLAMRDVNVDMQDIFYSENRITTFIENIALKEKSGLVLNKFTADVTYDNTHAELKDLYVETDKSKISRYMAVSYPSIASAAENIGEITVMADVDRSAVNMQDVLIFQPDLQKQETFARISKSTIYIDGKIDGQVKNLNIRDLQVAALNSTKVRLQGNIKGLPDAENAYYNLNFPNLSTTRNDLYILLPKNTLPESINVPGSISMRGFFRGTTNNFTARTDANTSYGDASILAYMQNAKNAYATYQANLSTRNLDLGKLVRGQDSLLGPVSLKAAVDGKGTDRKTMYTKFDVDVSRAEFNKYNYKDLTVNGKIADQAFTGKAQLKDTVAAFVFDGSIGLSEENPYYKFNFDLQGADLQAMHFTQDDIRVKGSAVADIRGSDLNSINGSAGIQNVLFVKNDREYPVRNFLFASISEKRNTDIKINSDFLEGEFKGTINLGDLAKELRLHLNRYFDMQDTSIHEPLEPNEFTFNINLKHTELITDILYPDLKRFIPGKIEGSYSSRSKNLSIDIDIPQIIYLDYTLDSIKIDVNSDSRRLNYDLALEKFTYGDILIKNPSVGGYVESDSVFAAFNVKDDKGRDKFLLSSIVESDFKNRQYMLHLKPDGIVFNYERWTVNLDNYLLFGGKTIYANNINLTNGERYLKVYSKGGPKQKDPPLFVDFRQFDLAAVTAFIEEDKSLVSGLLNGNVQLENLSAEEPGFQSDLVINKFSYKRDTLGDVAVKADNLTANRYTLWAQVTGNGNNVTADGFYANNNKANAYNFNVDIGALQLKTVEAYTSGQLADMEGNISGNLKLTGSTDAPNINGKVNFNGAGFTFTTLGAHYRLMDETVVFNNTGIYFPDVTILDSLNNKAELSGYIYTKYFKQFRLDLALNTDNFRALSSTVKDNEMYYGKIFVSSRIKIKGDFTEPVIDGRVRLNQGTDITVVLPNDNAELVSREGVVEFIDDDSAVNRIMTRKKGIDTVKTEFRGADINLAIEIDRQARMVMVIDPDAGDNLDVRGNGSLSLSVSPSGQIGLTGRYEIAEGSYKLSFYNFVKRNFTIQEGSSITWLGSPTDARMDITAVYTTKTAALELLEPQLAGLTDADKTRYKQRLPFEVHMKMTGSMMKPEIGLGIELPEDERGAFGGMVQNRLFQLSQDESELNKQVFALLVFNRFMAEDPFGSTAGGNNSAVENTLNSSLSQLMTQQLNALAGRYLKDVELNFEVERYEDFSTGAPEDRTDLRIGLTKTLFNDRLTVNVGSDVMVEGSSTQNTSTNNNTGNDDVSEILTDISIEYKITKDGRLRLTIFRNNEYAGIIEGQLVETGAGLIFVRDFNKFKELLAKPKDDDELL